MAAINMVKKLMGGLAGIHFECELVDDTEAREKTGVVIRYDDRGLPMFSITGLNELPQITIQLDYANHHLIIQSQDRQNNELYESGIQSFLMLDPRVLLDVCLRRSKDMAETPGGEIIIQFSIDDFNNYIEEKFHAGLPRGYLHWLKENGSNERMARLRIARRGSKVLLSELAQPDLPSGIPIVQQFRYQTQVARR